MSTNTASPPNFPLHHSALPYTSGASELQTLDIWLPRPLSESDPLSTIWIVYVHGGAWRDPTQTSSTVLPTLHHLSTSHPQILPSIAGVASLNYRLSPYPTHPTDPSDPNDKPRNVVHPSHVQDISLALSYLHKNYNVGAATAPSPTETNGFKNGNSGYKFIAIGHSCGATLLLQYLTLNIPLPSETLKPIPTSLILLSGIYSLPHFLTAHTPPHVSPAIAKIYQDIVEGAFGRESEVWTDVSPVTASYKVGDVSEALESVVLGWSGEDALVEKEQWEGMRERLRDCGWKDEGERGEKKVVMTDLKGEHDWVWEDGSQIARLIEESVRSIVGR